MREAAHAPCCPAYRWLKEFDLAHDLVIRLSIDQGDCEHLIGMEINTSRDMSEVTVKNTHFLLDFEVLQAFMYFERKIDSSMCVRESAVYASELLANEKEMLILT